MRLANLPLVVVVLFGLVSIAFAAGNGAGAGGAGSQRAINSGLPPGEPGPLGSVNNPHRAISAQPAAIQGSPRPETAIQKDQ